MNKAPAVVQTACSEQRPPRVLHVHKFREVVGGVETHIDSLTRWQRSVGAVVDSFTVDDVPGRAFTPNPTTVRQAVASGRTLMWSRAARLAMERKLEEFKPDIVHLHSLYHHLSPSVLAACRQSRIPTLMTLHDYKLVAPCYVLYRDGRMCDLCVGRRVPVAAIRHRCIKGSAAASALCTIEHALHAPLYRAGVARFLVPSPYMRDLVVESGEVPKEKLEVIPLGVERPVREATPADSTSIVFFGRLAPEKGVVDLLKAWEQAALPEPWRLWIAGDGSLRPGLEARNVRGVHFVGRLDPDPLSELLISAAAVVVPSTSPETFGLSAAEAMAHGLPVLVSDQGNLPHLVGTSGQTLPAADPTAWGVALRNLAASPQERIRLGRLGRERVAKEFAPDVATRRIFAAYASASSAMGGLLGAFRAAA